MSDHDKTVPLGRFADDSYLPELCAFHGGEGSSHPGCPECAAEDEGLRRTVAENYDPLQDLAELIAAGRDYRADAHVPAHRIAEHLGLSEGDSAETVAAELRKALGLCRCAIDGGPGTVIPIACRVHGTPCESCGGVESCAEDCGEVPGA